MALNGIWQLKKLVVRYCDWGGSSRGMREFIQSHLPSFEKSNPQVEVVIEMMRGKLPHLRGYYRCPTVRMVDSRNVDPKDILLQAIRLRNALGLKVTKLKTRHVITTRSVQGTWKTDLRIWSQLLQALSSWITLCTLAMLDDFLIPLDRIHNLILVVC